MTRIVAIVIHAVLPLSSVGVAVPAIIVIGKTNNMEADNILFLLKMCFITVLCLFLLLNMLLISHFLHYRVRYPLFRPYGYG